jgi:serine phosphatase RsbU (regulator of sigma subunit)
LEGIVAERTSEIRQKKDEIEEQNKALEDKNEEIETQKQEIEDINRDIISSITYAKRIQESILPSDSLVEKLFPKSFILYKPKDIVSGDFYWVEETDEYDYFSAVDCTGHGVPGAFVSIVGRNGLDKTVKEFNKRLPNEMLDLLTDVVIDSFSKNDKEEIKDGMDLALCALNKDRNKCYFSGANNPLWLIRSQEKGELIVNGDRIEPNLALEEYPFNLFEIKADPQPIGKYLDRQNFSLSEIDLEEGDTIYIFSDGYADQFGGPKGKKYLSKRFKKQLLSIQNMNIEDQKISINHANEEWMKDEEQLDDICVIGVKV